jgi:hypothetical protein
MVAMTSEEGRGAIPSSGMAPLLAYSMLRYRSARRRSNDTPLIGLAAEEVDMEPDVREIVTEGSEAR